MRCEFIAVIIPEYVAVSAKYCLVLVGDVVGFCACRCGSDDLTESSSLSYENYPRSRPILTGFRSPREPSGYSPRPPPATPPPAKFVVCESCSRTYRETVINKHVKEFHSKVRCTLCGATVDRYHLRKHQVNINTKCLNHF